MPVVAYLANQFPSLLEPYVAEEIQGLRRRGTQVVSCSARFPSTDLSGEFSSLVDETLYLQRWSLAPIVLAIWLCLVNSATLASLVWTTWFRKRETQRRGTRTLLHTCLGVYFAALLSKEKVIHIHVHHGYFASWIAMVAARILKIGFSMTLHGSDLLLQPTHLDTKLENCERCYTVSEFNRKFMLERYPQINPEKIVLRRLGVSISHPNANDFHPLTRDKLHLLCVGRLHPVKDHGFLLAACQELKVRRLQFECTIAGEGPSRPSLEHLIRQYSLEKEVRLLGHLSRSQLDREYARCHVAILTSRSEGIPVVLMEAMAKGKIVLAPDITGIPELVVQGETGFLYRAGSLPDLVSKVEMIRSAYAHLQPVGRRAREHVARHFDSADNLSEFLDVFLSHLRTKTSVSGDRLNENPILQQI